MTATHLNKLHVFMRHKIVHDQMNAAYNGLFAVVQFVQVFPLSSYLFVFISIDCLLNPYFFEENNVRCYKFEFCTS